MDLSTAEMFLLVWALSMTVLWQISNMRFNKLLRVAYVTAEAVADGKGKFVRTESNIVMFKEIE
jgi:hypothetical protein